MEAMSIINNEMQKFSCTQETVFSALMNAWMSCTYGNSEPVLVRMGKAFSHYVFARRFCQPSSFRSAVVMVDESLDSFTAQLFMWDKSTFFPKTPILFAAAEVVIADEAV
jgi:hypothetical protein